MIQSIHHITLPHPPGAEEEAAAFWAALGLRRVPKPPRHPQTGAWLIGGVELHVAPEDPFRPIRVGHPAFRVADLGTIRARLPGPIRDFDDTPGIARVQTDDPFGNLIEFVQVL